MTGPLIDTSYSNSLRNPAQGTALSFTNKGNFDPQRGPSVPPLDPYAHALQNLQSTLHYFCTDLQKATEEGHSRVAHSLSMMDKAILEQRQQVALLKEASRKDPIILTRKESVHCSPVNVMASLFLAILIISLFAIVIAVLGLTGVLQNVSLFFGSVNLIWAVSSCAAVGLISLIAFVCLSVYGFLHKEISTDVVGKPSPETTQNAPSTVPLPFTVSYRSENPF